MPIIHPMSYIKCLCINKQIEHPMSGINDILFTEIEYTECKNSDELASNCASEGGHDTRYYWDGGTSSNCSTIN